MKLLFAFAVILGLTTGHALAQGAQGVLVKNKAKGIAADNNARQGIAAPGTAAGPAGAPAPRAGIDPAQQQNIDKLAEDLKAIKSGVAATAEQKQMLHSDFTTLAKAAIKPSQAALSKLSIDLAAALSEKSINVTEQPQLAKALNVVFNGASLSPTQVQTFITNAQNALKDSGMTAQQMQPVTDDLKAIFAEYQAGKAKP